jgi:uncharacterized membrane protein YphA (DoxX/SURF4 family)
MDLKKASHLFFAVTMIAIGLIGLIGGGFAPIWQPVPESLPGRELLGYLTALIALGCGAGLLARRTAVWAALLLLIVFIIWTIAFKVPFIVHAPLEEGPYQSTGENAVLIAAAWLLYAEAAASRRYLAGDAAVRIAYVLYGLALIAFGLSHFFYLQLTAPLVPGWLQWPVFWAYLTGAIYLATGIAILVGVATRLASLLVAFQITLITLLVWGPVLAAGHLSAMHWQETVVSWALTAGAWVIASGSPPAIGWPRRSSP